MGSCTHRQEVAVDISVRNEGFLSPSVFLPQGLCICCYLDLNKCSSPRFPQCIEQTLTEHPEYVTTLLQVDGYSRGSP